MPRKRLTVIQNRTKVSGNTSAVLTLSGGLGHIEPGILGFRGQSGTVRGPITRTGSPLEKNG